MFGIKRSLTSVLAGLFLAGCHVPGANTPYTAPPAPNRDTRLAEVPKPMPAPDPVMIPPGPQPYYDEPILVDQPPEAKRFVEVYNDVNRPRIVVFVNRSLEGRIIPTLDAADDRGGYLRPGEYDVLNARSIDYGMFEMQLADWMSADGKVNIVSPMLVHRTLTPDQEKALQEGRVGALTELAKTLRASILIQVQARPTRQTPAGLDLRMVAESIDVQTGESLSRVGFDVSPPFDKYAINRHTRFMARKLMDGMIQNWSTPRGQVQPASAEAPAPAPVLQQPPAPESLPPATQPSAVPQPPRGGIGPRIPSY